MPNIQIPEKLMPLIQKPKRFKGIFGGRGSGKSNTVVDISLMDAQVHGMKIGMFREFQNSIDDSVYSLLCDEIDRLGLDGFSIQNSKITSDTGGGFTFKGLARNPESVKSMAGYKRFVVEEAQTISQKSLELLTPTLREDDSEVWFIANPRSSGDPLSQRFIVPFQEHLDRDGYYEDDLHLIIMCNYDDNPFFPDVLEQERVFDFNNKPRAVYDHVWLGKFMDDIENSIIQAEWFDACVDAHKKLNFKAVGKKVVSHDPSDVGSDDKGLCFRHGSVVLDVISSAQGDVNDGFDWALGYAKQKDADVFLWDGDGLGLSLRRQASEALSGTRIDQQIFRGSESPDRATALYDPVDSDVAAGRTNKEVFRNKRAQYYWMLRDRMYNTYRAVTNNEYIDPDQMISFSSDITHLQKLRSEVCRIPLRHNSNGFIQIESKERMLKDGIPSPNMADALMMSLSISGKITRNSAVIPPKVKPIGRNYGLR